MLKQEGEKTRYVILYFKKILKTPKTVRADKFGNAAEYTTSTQKFLGFLKNKSWQRISIHIIHRKNEWEYIRINITKKVNDLYKDNYKTQATDIDKDPERWELLMIIRKTNNALTYILHYTINEFSAISTKI